ncbi:MAG TPA: HAD domain-containing protein [Bacteroidia bacterium]|nr:HAD domain-containing protein [Bacteroidia bacterium]
MKVLFLDIDGVINSNRTCYAFGGYPHELDPASMKMFDPVAIRLIQLLCEETGAVVVLSSTWRMHFTCEEIGKAFGLPVLDKTIVLNDRDRIRGDEIKEWLDRHPEVTKYANVDDNSDMLADQLFCFVKTDDRDGLSLDNYLSLKFLLGVKDEQKTPD